MEDALHLLSLNEGSLTDFALNLSALGLKDLALVFSLPFPDHEFFALLLDC